MLRVSALYPHSEGARFDHDYYHEQHLALVRDKLGPHGLVRVEADRGLPGPDGGPPVFVAAAHLYFDSPEAFQRAFEAGGQALQADTPNYTDITPQIQVSEIAVSDG